MNMNSFYSKLFLDLQEHLSQELPEVKWIDLDYGQADYDRPRVAYPAILIDFPSANFSELGELAQQAEVTISIKLVIATWGSAELTAQVAPTNIKEKGLKHLEMEHRIAEVLHGWYPDEAYCTPLIRISTDSNNQSDIGLRTRILRFTTSFQTEMK